MAKPKDAYELALRALGRKERTASELGEWLRARGCEGEDADDAVSRLAEAGVLNDDRFARLYARDKRELRGWGPDRIAESLRARGVDEGIIDRVASESDAESAQRALELLEHCGAEAADERSRQRALALLARRGYTLEASYDAVRALEGRSRAA